MAIRMITGRAGSGKTEQCMQEIVSLVAADPLGEPLIWIVPEQATYEAERELYKRLMERTGMKGMLRVQVTSFQRLAWRVLHETGVPKRERLNELGQRLLVHRLLIDHKDQLKLYHRSEPQTGLVDRISDLFDEFQRYGIGRSRLAEWLLPVEEGRHPERGSDQQRSGPLSPLLRQKCNELAYLYIAFLDDMETRGWDVSDPLDLLLRELVRWEPVERCEVWIDGFHGFTPQEHELILKLGVYCRQVSITLPMPGPVRPEAPVDEGTWYEPAARTMQRIFRGAKREGAGWLLSTLERRPDEGRFSGSFALQQLEAVLSESRSPEPLTEHDLGMIRLGVFPHRRAEVEFCAQQMLRKIREGSSRFRDMLVITRDAAYADLIRLVFDAYEIPYFMDEKKPLRHHPVLDAVSGAFEALRTNWRSDAVFRLFKSPAYVPDMPEHARDALENMALEFGLRGPSSYEKAEWPVAAAPWKEQVIRPLRTFQSLMADASSGRDRAGAVKQFLKMTGTLEWLQRQTDADASAGRTVQAAVHSQVWQHLLDWLQQTEVLLGNRHVTLNVFERLWLAAAGRLTVAMIPPAFDQVIVGHADRTRSFSPKHVFVIGVVDGVFPKAESGDGLFTEVEREMLADAGYELAPSARHLLREESYAMYSVLTRASRELFISYPMQDEEGKSLLPSPLIPVIQRALPGIRIRKWTAPSLWDVVHPRMVSEALTTDKQLLKPDDWRALIRPVIQLLPTDWALQMNHMLQSVTRTVPAHGRLPELLAKQLYGTDWKTSISKLETFSSCPHRFFSGYGLRLKERNEHKVEASDLGSLYHHVMQKVLEEWQAASGLPAFQGWDRTISDPAVSRWTGELLPQIRHSLLTSSPRRMAHGRQVERFLQENAAQVIRQLQGGSFRPLAMELPFERTLIPPSGGKVILQGKIDRIDEWVHEGNHYVRIIDYKSREHPVSWAAIDAGLELQVISYLDAVTEQMQSRGLNVHPAGFFYFGMGHKWVNAAKDVAPEEVKEKYDKLFKMDGYVIEPSNGLLVARAMDHQLESGAVRHSNIVKVERKNDGTAGSRSKLLLEDEYRAVSGHVQSALSQLAGRILDGETSASPVQQGKDVACRFCEFRPVCQFDARWGDQQVRTIQKTSQKQWFEKMASSRTEELPQ